MKAWKLIPVVVLVLVSVSAQAAPPQVGRGLAAPAPSSDVVPVEWRGRGGGGGCGVGALLGLGTGVVVGSIIADRAYRPRPGRYYDEAAYDGPCYYPADYRGDPREICAQNFRSFEWRSGLYTTYSGEKRLCPYLI